VLLSGCERPVFVSKQHYESPQMIRVQELAYLAGFLKIEKSNSGAWLPRHTSPLVNSSVSTF
jgi:hypothetical protein